MAADFYSILEQKIEAVRADPTKSRQLVYDLARYALKNKAYARDPLLTPAQIQEQLMALEVAIALIEANVAKKDAGARRGAKPDPVQPPPADYTYFTPPEENNKPAENKPDIGSPDEGKPEVVRESRARDSRRDLVVLPPQKLRRRDHYVDEFAPRYDPVPAQREPTITPETMALIQLLASERRSAARRVMSFFDGLLRLAIVAAIGVGIYLVGPQRLGEMAGLVPPPPPPPPQEAPASQAAVTPPPPPEPAPVVTEPSVPRPNVYGVYAIRDGRLIALEQITPAPVDTRARDLKQITGESRTVFPDGRVEFTVYQRDLVNSAPVTVPIRFAAKIESTMRYGPGGTLVMVRPETDTWLIYSAGFNFRVLPVPENREMILIRPDDPDFALPPGRYVLLLNDQPYDFRVAGEVTDPRACVEGAMTPRGPVFYQCKKSENP